MTKNKLLMSTLLLGWLFILYSYATRMSDSVIIDQLMHTLQIGPGRIGILSSAFYLSYVFMQIPAGLLIDRYGICRAWTLAVAIIALGCFLFSISTDASLASFARVLMGIGSAFAWIGTIGVIYRLTGEKHAAFLIGVSMTLCMLGAILGQGPWLWLTQHLGNWQQPYQLAAVIGIVLAGFVLLMADKKNKQMDLTHDLLSIIRAIWPLFHNGKFWILIIYLMAISLPQNAFTALWAVEFLKRTYLLSPKTASWLMSLIWLGGLFGAPVIGFIADRSSKKRMLMLLSGMSTLILMLWVIFFQPHSIWLLGALLFLIGFITNASVIVYAQVAKIADSKSTSSALGFANMVNMGGAALVQVVTGWILSLTMTAGNIGNFYWALCVIPVILFLSTISVLALNMR